MQTWMPILDWLPRYQRVWFWRDLLAGASVCAVLVPLGLAYAELVGVDPVVGLYTIPPAVLAYSIFGGTRLLTVGPDAAVAVLSGAIVASLAVGGDQHLALTLALALLVGVLYVLFFFLKMGWIADLIPDPVIKGFVEGLVWVTILKQIPVLLGLDFEGSSTGFLPGLLELAQALPQAHVATALLGVSCVVGLYLLRRFQPRLPGPLIILAASVVLVGLLGLGEAGVAVLGQTQASLAGFGLPTGLEPRHVIALIPGALAIVVLGFTKSVGALKRATERSGEPIDPDRELLAMGVCNVGAGLGGGYAVAGSLTATAANIDSGARTQVSNLCAGAFAALAIMFLLPLVGNLSLSSLAAIIIVLLAGLSDLGYFRKLWTVSREETMIGAAAFVGVLWFDVMSGVAIGVVLALFTLAYHIHHPPTAILGRTSSGAFVYIDDEHPEAEEIPGMLIWRYYAPLVFLNVRVLANELRSLTRDRDDLRVVVFDATASQGVDSSALNAMISVRDSLRAKGIDLWVVNPRQTGRKMLVDALQGTDTAIPPVFDTLADAVARFEQMGTSNLNDR